MHIVIPAAGKSTRFPQMRPKWLLTHPNGQLMVVEALKGLPLASADTVTLVVLKKHIDEYGCLRGVRSAFREAFPALRLTVVQLEEETKSQPETVARAIETLGLRGPIFIKDTDNFFRAPLRPGNFVCTYRLDRTDRIRPGNKSYVTTKADGSIDDIAEKRIIGHSFCAGGYGFESAEQFLATFRRLEHSSDLYVSHIVYAMLLDGVRFLETPVEAYLDWGTLDDWNRYKEGFATLFVDLDGVLVRNSSQFMHSAWGDTAAISPNADYINRLYDSGKVRIVITTAPQDASAAPAGGH